MPTQNDADADDDAAAAANSRRVEVMATCLIVDQAPRVRSPYAAPSGAMVVAGTHLVCTQESRVRIPVAPPRGVMPNPIQTRNQLWRLCTNFTYRSLPGGTAGLQNRRAEFDSLAACQGQVAKSGKALDCNPSIRRFESDLALQHDVVVAPTQVPRTGDYRPAPG